MTIQTAIQLPEETFERLASAAREIKAIIAQSSMQVQTGVGLVNKSGESLNNITTRITELEAIISGIASATSEQSSGLHEVSSAIGSVDTITQQNAIMVDKTSGQIADLTDEVEKLNQALRGFKTRDPNARAGRADGPERRDRAGSARSHKAHAA